MVKLVPFTVLIASFVVRSPWAIAQPKHPRSCAQSARTVHRTLYDQALSKAKDFEWTQARALLSALFAAANKSGCGSSVEVAQAHLLMGIVHFLGDKNRSTALARWRLALAILPASSLPSEFDSPRVRRAFASAVRLAKAAAVPRPRKPEGVASTRRNSVSPVVSQPPVLARKGVSSGPRSRWFPGHDQMRFDVTRYGLGNDAMWRNYRQVRSKYRVGLAMTTIGTFVTIPSGIGGVILLGLRGRDINPTEKMSGGAAAGIACMSVSVGFAVVAIIGAVIKARAQGQLSELGMRILHVVGDQSPPSIPSGGRDNQGRIQP